MWSCQFSFLKSYGGFLPISAWSPKSLSPFMIRTLSTSPVLYHSTFPTPHPMSQPQRLIPRTYHTLIPLCLCLCFVFYLEHCLLFFCWIIPIFSSTLRWSTTSSIVPVCTLTVLEDSVSLSTWPIRLKFPEDKGCVLSVPAPQHLTLPSISATLRLTELLYGIHHSPFQIRLSAGSWPKPSQCLQLPDNSTCQTLR